MITLLLKSQTIAYFVYVVFMVTGFIICIANAYSQADNIPVVRASHSEVYSLHERFNTFVFHITKAVCLVLILI